MSKKYNPQTGTWGDREDVYGPNPTNNSNSTPQNNTVTPKAETVPSTPKTPPTPTTPDKKNAHQGSGVDDLTEATEKIREFEYDLEGSAEIHPDPKFSNLLRARDMVVFGGMGNNFSGKYFLSTVVHTINRGGGYRMSFDVLRNNFVWTTIPEPQADTPPTTVPPKSEPVTGQQTYTVKKGDTLWAIAKRYYGNGADYMKIVEANRGKIKDPHWIYPNQVFVIPK